MNIILICAITGAVAGLIMTPSIIKKQKEAEAQKLAEEQDNLKSEEI